jgi:hypothetical protein
MIEAMVKASVGMTIILMAWLLVQSTYRRMIGGSTADTEALVDCWNCQGCSGMGGSQHHQTLTEPAARSRHDAPQSDECPLSEI